MTRLISLFVLLLPAANVLAGDLPQVLQPNATAYSASEVAALTQAITTLTEALNDHDMASRRYFSASDWSSRDFAMYTAEILPEEGTKQCSQVPNVGRTTRNQPVIRGDT